MKKRFIIIGDNNYCYGTTNEVDEKDAKKEIERAIKMIRLGINSKLFKGQDGKPFEFVVYEAKEIDTIKL